MLEEYGIDKLNPRPNPYAKLKMEGISTTYKQWQENYVQEAVNKAVGKAVQDTTNDIMERITDNLLKQHPEWTREKARAHAEALISV